MAKDKSKSSRRKVLQATGGILFPAMIGNASATTSTLLSGEKFEGVAYDPTTHEILGDASAKLQRSQTEISGALQILDQKIDVELGNPVVELLQNGKTKSRFREVEHGENGSTQVSALLVSFPKGVTGYVSSKTGQRVAFSVASTEAGLSKEDAENAVTGGDR